MQRDIYYYVVPVCHLLKNEDPVSLSHLKMVPSNDKAALSSCKMCAMTSGQVHMH
jgi:hypothetical protein